MLLTSKSCFTKGFTDKCHNRSFYLWLFNGNDLWHQNPLMLTWVGCPLSECHLSVSLLSTDGDSFSREAFGKLWRKREWGSGRVGDRGVRASTCEGDKWWDNGGIRSAFWEEEKKVLFCWSACTCLFSYNEKDLLWCEPKWEVKCSRFDVIFSAQ